MMEHSKRLGSNIVVRRRISNGVETITIAETQETWWKKTLKKIDDIIN